MIRALHTKDLHEAVSIWYSASVQAHGFIPEAFWHAQKDSMRNEYLPGSESWVYEVNNEILGFIAYYEGFIPIDFSNYGITIIHTQYLKGYWRI